MTTPVQPEPAPWLITLDTTDSDGEHRRVSSRRAAERLVFRLIDGAHQWAG